MVFNLHLSYINSNTMNCSIINDTSFTANNIQKENKNINKNFKNTHNQV